MSREIEAATTALFMSLTVHQEAYPNSRPDRVSTCSACSGAASVLDLAWQEYAKVRRA